MADIKVKCPIDDICPFELPTQDIENIYNKCVFISNTSLNIL